MIKLEKRRSSKDCLVEDDDACQARGNQITILIFLEDESAILNERSQKPRAHYFHYS